MALCALHNICDHEMKRLPWINIDCFWKTPTFRFSQNPIYSNLCIRLCKEIIRTSSMNHFSNLETTFLTRPLAHHLPLHTLARNAFVRRANAKKRRWEVLSVRFRALRWSVRRSEDGESCCGLLNVKDKQGSNNNIITLLFIHLEHHQHRPNQIIAYWLRIDFLYLLISFHFAQKPQNWPILVSDTIKWNCEIVCDLNTMIRCVATNRVLDFGHTKRKRFWTNKKNANHRGAIKYIFRAVRVC